MAWVILTICHNSNICVYDLFLLFCVHLQYLCYTFFSVSRAFIRVVDNSLDRVVVLLLFCVFLFVDFCFEDEPKTEATCEVCRFLRRNLLSSVINEWQFFKNSSMFLKIHINKIINMRKYCYKPMIFCSDYLEFDKFISYYASLFRSRLIIIYRNLLFSQ